MSGSTLGDMRSIPRDYRVLVKDAMSRGWTLRQTSAGWQLHAPHGGGIVTIHRLQPSDRRALRNFRADMRRAGYTERKGT